jgi:hypothetical protein
MMMHRRSAPFRLIALAGIVGSFAVAERAWGQNQVGDCDRNGRVTVDELVIGVNIALDIAPLASCPSFDSNGDGQVTVDELIVGVGNALTGQPQSLAFVIATDFQTGSFANVSLAAPYTVVPSSPSRQVNNDAVARTFDGLVYVVNRFGADNIQVLDPQRDFATTLQCSTGNGTNPNDIGFLSATKAYVARLGSPQVLIVNPSAQPDCSDFTLGTIDLSAFADADGIPDMNQLAVVGKRLYVSLERLQNFVPAALGAVIVIDTDTDMVLNEITLTGENPFGQTKGLTVSDGALVISETGNFGVNDGGIERVDLASGTAQGFFITEADLGGDISDFVLVSDHLGYALVSLPDFTTSMVAFDPTAGAVLRTVVAGASPSDIELDENGQLFMADRSVTNPGIRVFRASDGTELTPAPLSTGLPPFDIVFVR